MVSWEQIQVFCDHIIRGFQPEQVIVFGSSVDGTATEDSDVDVLVILPFDGRPAHKAAEILLATHAGFPVDLLVRTPDEVKQRLDLGDFFIREVMQKGRVVHEVIYNRVDPAGSGVAISVQSTSSEGRWHGQCPPTSGRPGHSDHGRRARVAQYCESPGRGRIEGFRLPAREDLAREADHRG